MNGRDRGIGGAGFIGIFNAQQISAAVMPGK